MKILLATFRLAVLVSILTAVHGQVLVGDNCVKTVPIEGTEGVGSLEFGRCTTAEGCAEPSDVGNCENGAICCSMLKSIPGEVCSRTLTETGFCIENIYCKDVAATPIVANTCEGDLSCCKNLPAVGESCFSDSFCILESECSPPVVWDPTSLQPIDVCDGRQLICCPKDNLPGDGQKCSLDFTNSGTCVLGSIPCESFGDSTTFPGTLCKTGFKCCGLPEAVISQSCYTASLVGTCTNEVACNTSPSDQGNCKDGSVCCTSLPTEFGARCSIDSETLGTCMLSDVCDGGAMDEPATCDISGGVCCDTLKSIGQRCHDSASCVLAKHCDEGSEIYSSLCGDCSVCCLKTGEPGEGESCSNSVTEGVCVASDTCTGEEISGILCQDDHVCCDRGKSEIGEECSIGGNSGICTNPNHCMDMEINMMQGACKDGAICCSSIPSMELDDCSLTIATSGECSTSCADAPAVSGTCEGEALTCCPADEVSDEVVSPCGRGGKCKAECVRGDIDTTSVDECGTGLVCCVRGLNKICSFSRNRRCQFREDCTTNPRHFPFSHRRCRNRNLVCC